MFKQSFFKTFMLLAALACSLTIAADTQLFDKANANIQSTYFRTYGWSEETVASTANYNSSTGSLTVNIGDGKGDAWQAQVFLSTGVTIDPEKTYDVSFSLIANHGIGGVWVKSDGTGSFFGEQIALGENVQYNYSKTNCSGTNDGTLIFDFGYSPANTTIEITNISIVEKDAVDYCSGTASASSNNATAAQSADGNLGTRWASKNEDGNEIFWQRNYAEAQTFNRVKIVWEGAWGRSFDILAGNDCEHLVKIAEVRNQSLAGFPYNQIIELAESVTAKHIRFQGVEKATGYGYSFWELEVYEAVTSVLTSLDFNAASQICKVGQTVALTSTPKDQYGVAMDGQTVTYTVTPSTAGHVTAGVYTADALGAARITATCGALSKSVDVVNYLGENVALNKTVTASGYNDASRVNDGNDGTEFQADPSNGTAAHDVTCVFTIDLGAAYDLNLVTIHFEGACSDAYTLETSADNAVFATAHSFSGTLGINNHTDFLYQSSLNNADAVRYLKFTSTKNSTDWGMKIYEFMAFGTEAASATKNVSASVNDAAMGTAVVKQGGVEVSSVDNGTSVTFTANENAGYLFLGWYKGAEKVSSDLVYNVAAVTTNLSLQARFRALGTNYCATQITKNEHTALVTIKETSENHYRLTVRSAENLNNFGGTELGINNTEVVNIRDNAVISADRHMQYYDFESTSMPTMRTPLYVLIQGVGEVAFDQLTNIECAVACDDNVAVESVTLNRASANMSPGDNVTLLATVAPVYASNQNVVWTTSKSSVATVSDGVVTAVALGEATITATTEDGSKVATCLVTVAAPSDKVCWGNGSDAGIALTYSMTYSTDKKVTIFMQPIHDKDGFVMQVNDGDWRSTTSVAGGYSYSDGLDHEVGETMSGFFWMPYAGGVGRVDYNYTVGDECAKAVVEVTGMNISVTSTTLAIAETIQLSANVLPANADDQSFVWASSANGVATVSPTGLVTAVAAGTANITATSTNGNVATCVVTVAAAIEPTYFISSGRDAGNEVDVAFQIVRNADHTLTYTAKPTHSKDGFVFQVNDGDWHTANLADGVYTWTSTATFVDGANVNGFFYMPYAGGAARVDYGYVVGADKLILNETLDNGKAMNMAEGKSLDVALTRSFVADGYWYTLCLPFDMTSAQVSEAFGSCTIAEMTGSEMHGDILHIDFDHVNTIQAGMPYLFMPAANVVNPTIEGVTIDASASTVNATSLVTMTGFYAPTVVTSPNLFLGDNNYLLTNDNASATNAFRAYFTLNGVPAGVRAKVVFNGQVATDVADLEVSEDEVQKIFRNGTIYILKGDKVYTVQGQLVE